uniref:UDP-3-O-acylglucosamine N-acyltransferase n=1 Tax=Dictyoglomus thermophilum TaxID=14 RepID=A0A7C3RS65_DICTH
MHLSEIAKIINGELVGEDVYIEKISEWDKAGDNDLIFVFDLDDIKVAEKTGAKAMVIPYGGSSSKPHIRVENPKLAMAELLKYFDWRVYPKDIHPTVIMGKGIQLGEDVGIAPYTVIGDNVKIGKGSKIFSGVVIGNNVEIGENCIIYPRVTIYDHCYIGDRVIIHSGCSIGIDGFGYVWNGEEHYKIPHIGKVVIEDEVEIGGNTVIERATLGETRIGKGTKIGSLIIIGHNVRIGENCVIVSQSGIAGSSKLGNNVIMAGQSGVSDHVKVGNNVTILAKSGVIKDIPDNMIVSGFPARPHREEMRVQAIMRRLPEIWEEIKKLRDKLG